MSVSKTIPVAWQRTHDHGQCIVGAIDAAARICESRGIRLTPLRRRVLELVWENHKRSARMGCWTSSNGNTPPPRRRQSTAHWIS